LNYLLSEDHESGNAGVLAGLIIALTAPCAYDFVPMFIYD